MTPQAELFKSAVKINLDNPLRTGNIIKLPEDARVILTGDMHGHRPNFEKITGFADLENNPNTHLVLQEIIHGGPEDPQGGCLSFELMLRVVEYQKKFPEQVHIIIGNHDTSVITDSDVLKAGREMNIALKQAMQRCFKENFTEVLNALREYMFSMPLAVKTANRIWASHSLPADRFAGQFDPKILERKLQIEDMKKPGSVYLLTWGRRHAQQTLDKFAEMLDVDIFLLGHQKQPHGFTKAGENLIILASDHNHGCFVEFSTSENYSTDQLMQKVKPLASI